MSRLCTSRVDLVGENIVTSRRGDRQVEASQQFSQGLAFSAYQHGQVVMFVVGLGSDAPEFREHIFTGTMTQPTVISLPVGCFNGILFYESLVS